MHQGKYVFAQVMESAPHYQFNRCVDRYNGDRGVRSLTCREQFLAMAFGQFAYRESLRDVCTCLRAQQSKQYHLGFRSTVTRSTLADANERRDWRIYRDFVNDLIDIARKLYLNDPGFLKDLEGTYYAIDSTSIDLCLSVFSWAPFMDTKGAVKLHTQMDLRGSIPTYFHITDGKVNDVHFLDVLTYEHGAHYIMDRGYVDYERLHAIHRSGAFFVTRAKRNMVWKRLYSHDVDRTTGVCCDQTIRFASQHGRARYPDTLRRVKFYDAETERYYVFITNDFNMHARTVAHLYKHRWQIELFFRWIKQHLKIKTFWGHSENAVKTQLCIAIGTYLIVAILKKRLGIDRELYEMLQILSVSLFDTTPVFELFSNDRSQVSDPDPQIVLPFKGI